MTGNLIRKLQTLKSLLMKKVSPSTTTTTPTPVSPSLSEQLEATVDYSRELQQKLDKWTTVSYPRASSSSEKRVAKDPPKYAPGDVVYIIPHPLSQEYTTTLGLPTAIDCKVIGFIFHPTVGTYMYTLTSGRGGAVQNVPEEILIHGRDRCRYENGGFITALEDTEFFKSGTTFAASGDYFSNDELGVHMSKELVKSRSHLFSLKTLKIAL